MDDYEDLDLEEEMDEFDGGDEFENDGLDDFDEGDDEKAARLMELELQGAMDGEIDADAEDRLFASYGMSVDDLDDLSDEEKEAYEDGYMSECG